MSDPTTPTPTPADALHSAVEWLKAQPSNVLRALGSLSLSKPTAELVATVEDSFARVLPTVLAAGEKSLADELTPEHMQALATLVGEIGAEAVRQFLARIPAAVAAAASTTL